MCVPHSRQAATHERLEAMDGVDASGLELARGAPNRFDSAVEFGLGLLAKMSEGRFTIENTTLAVEGRATTAADFDSFETALKLGAPQGLILASAQVRPPLADPFVWAAEKDADGRVRMSGYVPSAAARESLHEAVKGLDGDNTAIADGNPPNFEVEAVAAGADPLAEAEAERGNSNDLALSLVFLKSRDASASYERLATRLGPKRLNRMLSTTITFSAYANMVSQRLQEALRDAMIARFEDIADAIVDNTVARSRQIDTLPIHLRNLPPEFNDRVGVTRYLRLVRECATIRGLVAILTFSRPGLTRELWSRMDDTLFETLTERCIQKKRPLTALAMEIREQHERQMSEVRHRRSGVGLVQ